MVMHCSNQLSWCRPSWAGQHCHVIFDPLWSLNQTISSPLQQSTLCWCNASWSQRSWFMVIHHHNHHPELSSIYLLKNNWNCNLNAVTKCRLSILTQGLNTAGCVDNNYWNHPSFIIIITSIPTKHHQVATQEDGKLLKLAEVKVGLLVEMSRNEMLMFVSVITFLQSQSCQTHGEVFVTCVFSSPKL